jgi:hypothetical protein
MQKSIELTTSTRIMQTNTDYHPQTTNLEISSSLLLRTGRLIAHHANLITNGIAYSKD